MSLAHGGQVLVSDATEALLRNRVALRPLGEQFLAGTVIQHDGVFNWDESDGDEGPNGSHGIWW